MHKVILGLCGLLSATALTGCRNRAYNDLYVENMASEIRDLENQLYEYDHEYRLVEQELEALRQENAALKAAPSPDSSKRSLLSPRPTPDYYSPPKNSPAPLEFQHRSQGMPPTPDPIEGAEKLLLEPESILEKDSSSRQTQPTDKFPDAPKGGSPPSESKVTPEPLPTRPPVVTPPNSTQSGNDSRETSPQSNLPGSRNGDPLPANPPPPSSTINPQIPELPAPANVDEPKSNELLPPKIELPPTIEPGVPVPPQLPSVSQRMDGSPVAPEDNLEMNLSRIEIPDQKSPTQLASGSQIKQATVRIATEKVTDTRVVELAFHPTLSRPIDLDDRPDDDGLYLVLQPKNERGQMVPVTAALTIFVLDPAREGDAAKIGRWEYSAADVESKLQPIGSEQGIHLQLPWNGPDPSADRVIVFALFKFDNGRQVMGEKEIFVSKAGNRKTAWTARGNHRSTIPEVAQAGYNTPLGDPKASAYHVVRPASGVSTFDPAPAP